jgi:hypothetical protein
MCAHVTMRVHDDHLDTGRCRADQMPHRRHLVIERRRTQSVELELFPAVPTVRERRIAM